MITSDPGMNFAWRKWKLGVFISIMLSVLVAGSGLAAGMRWQAFVSVLCTALLTHLGAFLKDHPVDQVSFDETPTTPQPKDTAMKNLTALLTLAGLLCLAPLANAQTTDTNQAPPTVTSSLSDLWTAIKLDHTNWLWEVHGLYAPALQSRYGGGLGAFHPITQYMFGGLRVDWVDGGFWMPSGDAGLQLPIQPFSWLKVTPFTYAGIGIPLSGASIGGFTVPGHARNNDGQATAILGYGLSVGIYNSKSGRWGVDLVADRENWSGFAGQQYRFGLLLHKKF